jgi:hypothetical protein
MLVGTLFELVAEGRLARLRRLGRQARAQVDLADRGTQMGALAHRQPLVPHDRRVQAEEEPDLLLAHVGRVLDVPGVDREVGVLGSDRDVLGALQQPRQNLEVTGTVDHEGPRAVRDVPGEKDIRRMGLALARLPGEDHRMVLVAAVVDIDPLQRAKWLREGERHATGRATRRADQRNHVGRVPRYVAFCVLGDVDPQRQGRAPQRLLLELAAVDPAIARRFQLIGGPVH